MQLTWIGESLLCLCFPRKPNRTFFGNGKAVAQASFSSARMRRTVGTLCGRLPAKECALPPAAFWTAHPEGPACGTRWSCCRSWGEDCSRSAATTASEAGYECSSGRRRSRAPASGLDLSWLGFWKGARAWVTLEKPQLWPRTAGTICLSSPALCDLGNGLFLPFVGLQFPPLCGKALNKVIVKVSSPDIRWIRLAVSSVEARVEWKLGHSYHLRWYTLASWFPEGFY